VALSGNRMRLLMLLFLSLNPFTSGQGIIPDRQAVQKIRKKSTTQRISIFFF
jgi:hypothetical protein